MKDKTTKDNLLTKVRSLKRKRKEQIMQLKAEKTRSVQPHRDGRRADVINAEITSKIRSREVLNLMIDAQTRSFPLLGDGNLTSTISHLHTIHAEHLYFLNQKLNALNQELNALDEELKAATGSSMSPRAGGQRHKESTTKRRKKRSIRNTPQKKKTNKPKKKTRKTKANKRRKRTRTRRR